MKPTRHNIAIAELVDHGYRAGGFPGFMRELGVSTGQRPDAWCSDGEMKLITAVEVIDTTPPSDDRIVKYRALRDEVRKVGWDFRLEIFHVRERRWGIIGLDEYDPERARTVVNRMFDE